VPWGAVDVVSGSIKYSSGFGSTMSNRIAAAADTFDFDDALLAPSGVDAALGAGLPRV